MWDINSWSAGYNTNSSKPYDYSISTVSGSSYNPLKYNPIERWLGRQKTLTIKEFQEANK